MSSREPQSTRLELDSYVRECHLYLRRVVIFAGVTILTVILCFAVVLPFRDQIKDWVAERFGFVSSRVGYWTNPVAGTLGYVDWHLCYSARRIEHRN